MGWQIPISTDQNAGNAKISSIDAKQLFKFLKKYSLKDTVSLILETEKVNKKKVYDICLKIKNEKDT